VLRDLLKHLRATFLGNKPPGARFSASNHGDAAGTGAEQVTPTLTAYVDGDLAASQHLYGQDPGRDVTDHESLLRLGVAEARAENYQAATEFFDRAVAINPRSLDAVNGLANIARLQERWRDAEVLYRRALALDSGAVAVWANLGLCLREAGDADAALTTLQHALELEPDYPEALLNLALVHIDFRGFDAARALLERALEIEPKMAEAHTALAHLLLQQGDFQNGWPQYEWRFLCSDAIQQRQYPYPRWDGAPIPGRLLVIRSEQGLGDQLMLASCLPDAISRAGHCIVECDQRLVGLFARSFPDASFFGHLVKREPEWAAREWRPDYQIFLGSLAGLFRTRGVDFPPHHGYLIADPARVHGWRARLAQLGPGLKIGISWRGGARRTRHRWRSIPLSEWLPVLGCTGAQFVSLQYGNCADEIEALQHDVHIALTHWPQAIEDYEETAGLVAALDLVITVQTAVAHLAGALGRPAWVLVPAVPEWRYMANGDTMPWYPSVRLFRQPQAGSWEPVLMQVAAELAQLAKGNNNVGS
jgi:hypothetical protein